MSGSAAVVAPGRKLGKTAPKYDPRTLRLARYIEKRRLPHVPKTHTLSKKTLRAFPVLGKMRNDVLGCCTCAALAHMEQTWSVYGGTPKRPTDAEVVEAYDRINGGVDEGAPMLEALKMARKVGIGGNTIHAFVAIDPWNHDQTRTGQFLFGGIYAGANLPVSAMSQDLWDVGEGPEFSPGSWGGHAFNVIDYGVKGLTIVTWGGLQRLTWAFWDRYVDEAYVVLEHDYLGDDNRSPQGFSLKKLADDLRGL